MLNQESPAVIQEIFRKTYQALAPGGLVIVQDQMLDDDKSGPVLSAMIGVNQLLHTPGGAAHSGQEVAEWLAAAGFGTLKRIPMPASSPFTVLTGVKPS
jgi:hypothetical protein